MKVLIDAHMLGTREGGNERYIKNLILSLKNLDQAQITSLIPSSYKIFSKNDVNTIDIGNKYLNDIIRLTYSLPALANKLKVDIIHTTYFGPTITSAKLIIMVHDFSFKRYPNLFSSREQLLFKYLLPLSLKKANIIIVPSEFTKQEGIKYYPHLKEKFIVTYEAADRVFKPISKQKATQSLKRTLGINHPFLLTFNNRLAKKNVQNVIRAFSQIKEKFPHLTLVILGGKHNIQPHQISSRIIIFDYVADKELAMLYNASRAVIYYSLYEGFGLPLVEAMSCGAAVIASDIQVHREIAKNGVIYAKPQDPKDLATKIQQLLTNPQLKKRLEINDKHIANQYSWSKTAQTTIQAYKKALGKT